MHLHLSVNGKSLNQWRMAMMNIVIIFPTLEILYWNSDLLSVYEYLGKLKDIITCIGALFMWQLDRKWLENWEYYPKSRIFWQLQQFQQPFNNYSNFCNSGTFLARSTCRTSCSNSINDRYALIVATVNILGWSKCIEPVSTFNNFRAGPVWS